MIPAAAFSCYVSERSCRGAAPAGDCEGHTNVPWHIPFFYPEEEKFRMIPMGSRILPIRNAECERHDGSGQEMDLGKDQKRWRNPMKKSLNM